MQIETSKDVVMLSGRVSSAAVADKILEVVKNVTPKVTSLMEIPPAPVGDVLIEVKFAEVDKIGPHSTRYQYIEPPRRQDRRRTGH